MKKVNHFRYYDDDFIEVCTCSVHTNTLDHKETAVYNMLGEWIMYFASKWWRQHGFEWSGMCSIKQQRSRN